ncbi:MAG: patatin-like phospholipase family protein [Pseudomonadota bacterium]
MAFKLVSCDGGGIRGYLSCLILQGLQNETGFLEKAEGFAGTSTGGLIAVTLADGRSQGKDMTQLIGELTSLYRDKADQIFCENERTFADKVLDNLARKFRFAGGPGITAAHYNASGLLKIGHDLVGDRTVGTVSSDLVLAVNTVCLHGSEHGGWVPVSITNQDLSDQTWIDMRAVRLLDVAMASSAAPTYFPPHLVEANGVDYGYFADGGTFANNPVLNGMNVAIAAKKAEGLAHIEVISVGTGKQPTDISEEMIKDPEDWGLLKWFGVTSKAPKAALLEMLLTTSAENLHWMAHLVLKDRMVRLNPPLPKVVGLATISDHAYELMEEAFDFTRNSLEWRNAVEMLRHW